MRPRFSGIKGQPPGSDPRLGLCPPPGILPAPEAPETTGLFHRWTGRTELSSVRPQDSAPGRLTPAVTALRTDSSASGSRESAEEKQAWLPESHPDALLIPTSRHQGSRNLGTRVLCSEKKQFSSGGCFRLETGYRVSYGGRSCKHSSIFYSGASSKMRLPSGRPRLDGKPAAASHFLFFLSKTERRT